MRVFLKSLIPPFLITVFRVLKNRDYSWKNKYNSWDEANNQATGYSENSVLKAVRASSLKVKNGEATYERDSVCFYEEDFRWPVLSCLMFVAARSYGALNVLDYGGALGSFYFQHYKFFNELKSLNWAIVEQKHFVECGRAEFQNDELKFYLSVPECSRNQSINVVLLSSVLQYIKDPYDLLNEIVGTDASFIIIDRTPFSLNDSGFITIQNVPGHIFNARLPVNVLSEESIDSFLTMHGYNRKVDFLTDESKVGEVYFKGIFYERYK